MAKLAKHTVEQSDKAFQSLKDSASNDSAKLKQKFFEQMELAETILSQTEHELQGQKSIPERIVSFHDPQVRPIRQRETEQGGGVWAHVAIDAG